MTTRITGLVTNPDGSLLDGKVSIVPLAWHTDTAPDRLVSTNAVNADVTDGVVDLDIDTDGELPWRLTVTSGVGVVRMQAHVIPPASGEVRIDQLAPAPSTDVAVAPNPGPVGPPGAPGEVTLEQLQQLVQRDSGWRCWSVADWGPVTIGTQSGIVGQYQWLWRRIGSVVFYGARMKRDTALTVTSGQAVSSYRAISPHPMWMDMSFPESNVTGFISISFRDTNDPVPLTGNTPFSIFPSVGVFNVQAASTSVGGYVPGTWRSAISAANVTDAPWPDTLPGDPYEGSMPSEFLPPPSHLGSGSLVTADDLAALRAQVQADMSVAADQARRDWLADIAAQSAQSRQDWIVDFQVGLLDALRVWDTGWVDMADFRSQAPTGAATAWQIGKGRRIGDRVEIILGFTLGNTKNTVLGTLPLGWRPDEPDTAMSAMFSPDNTTRGDVEIGTDGNVYLRASGATTGNQYRVVLGYHTSDEFPSNPELVALRKKAIR